MEFRGGSVLGTIQEAHSTQDTLSGYTHAHNTPETPKPVFTISHSAAGWEDGGGLRKPSREEVQHDKPNLREGSECWGARHTLTLMTFLCLTLQYSTRVNLSIAIVAMVGPTSNNGTNETLPDTCPAPDDDGDSGGIDVQGEFNWDEQTQGLVLGAFYWGYATTNFVGGRAAEYLGGRLVLGMSLLLSSLLTLFNPLCASLSKELFIAIRIVQGIVQGVTYPSLGLLVVSWIPPKEKAILASIVYTGSQAGAVLPLAAGGWLCNSGFLGGWPSLFYVFGGLGLVCTVFWFLLVHNSPSTHPRISPAELRYIQSSQSSFKTSKLEVIPWKAIINSRPMWAASVIALGTNFSFFVLLSEMPTYFSNIQHLDIYSNGMVSALPYFIYWVFSIVWGIFMGILTQRGLLSVTWVRKISTNVAIFVSSAALVGLCFVNCDSTLAMAALCVSVGSCGASYSGSSLTEQDIGPSLVGTLVGINNTLTSITGFLAPIITGIIINGHQTLTRWKIVFIVTIIVNVSTNIFYNFFMSADVQPWNNPPTRLHTI
ncbi:sialin-like [Homarus americanus]|uniref:sialin-like n=1 Tax=Homarus americanus TaxID=6706 RepID=UPI001C442860|nr:sialin-like [Homarus americanus]